jgi:hypothetical protein
MEVISSASGRGNSGVLDIPDHLISMFETSVADFLEITTWSPKTRKSRECIGLDKVDAPASLCSRVG